VLCRAGWAGRLLWSRLLRVGASARVGFGAYSCCPARLDLTGPRLRPLPLFLFSLHKDTCAAREEKVQLPAAAAAVLRGSLFRPHTREMRSDRESGRSRFFRCRAKRFFRPVSTYRLRLTEQATTNYLPQLCVCGSRHPRDRDLTSHHRSLCPWYRRQLLRRRGGRGTIKLEVATMPSGLDITPLL
jgi:hypothetical protein